MVLCTSECHRGWHALGLVRIRGKPCPPICRECIDTYACRTHARTCLFAGLTSEAQGRNMCPDLICDTQSPKAACHTGLPPLNSSTVNKPHQNTIIQMHPVGDDIDTPERLGCSACGCCALPLRPASKKSTVSLRILQAEKCPHCVEGRDAKLPRP